ncbi:DUF2510 domain-containing protein [Streptomyces sp. SID4919]|uniref:DUF2510 domain-containing protein n=1 Tax=unclassified Streptomyces TaxID=2593676 RepID=UPI000823A5FB|nr:MULTISPECIES: DUF2510 domain-containing protein [unclassified Streptomyces]MYY09871.1 DUF2510 domain-containing protein [Streptomyces sp. SID4919]SCK58115.1 Protein of unknown function [Streptomyces sp. AmelKG-E11A]
MTHMTPPGWYPDPGQRSDGPPTERWWDGNAWTEQTRALGASGAWAPPAYPQWAVAPPPAKRRKAVRAAIGAVVALAVLGGLAGGVYALTLDDDKDGDRTATAPSPKSPGGPESATPEGGPGAPGAPSRPGAPQGEKSFAADPASGISLPVPEGWSGDSGIVGAQVSTGPYPCPGDAAKSCARAGAHSAPAAALKRTERTARAMAEADIADAAEEAYGSDSYGDLTSHDEIADKPVTVAGGKGHLVRWKVVTEKGDDGYVQSLAFPSPHDARQFVVVRFGFDVSDKAPALSVMDEITEGIKKSARGSGNGQAA